MEISQVSAPNRLHWDVKGGNSNQGHPQISAAFVGKVTRFVTEQLPKFCAPASVFARQGDRESVFGCFV